MVTPGGKGLLDLGDLLLHPIDDDARVLADQHHDDADHRLASTVAGHRALADHRRQLGATDIAHVDGRAALVVGQNDRFQVLQRLDQAFAADQVLLAAAGDVAAADVAVVGLDGREDITDRQAIRHQIDPGRGSPDRSSAHRRTN